jgi:hypothetical protein
MAMVNATSNVLFMPYMAAFHPNYLTAYFVGMGLSSLIPSIVSLAQGIFDFFIVTNHFFRNITVHLRLQQFDARQRTDVYAGSLPSP